MKHGVNILTESGEQTKEITDVRIKITSPLEESERISPKCFMGIKGFKEYAKNLIYGYSDSVVFEYDYHERLRKWGRDKISLYNAPVSIDQIDYIINKLKDQKNSRRALAVTWMPCYDENKDDVPCLQLVQCLVRNGKLDMYIVFRSEDILSAYGQNVYGLTEMQKYIADAIGVPVGDYYHYVISAHIYHIRDAHELDRFVV
jgi:thymidylate synthase